MPLLTQRRKKNRERLRMLTMMVAASGGTGLLLFLPPFAIWPFYSYTLWIHTWFGIAVAALFVPTLMMHGVTAWNRSGLNRLAQSGLALGVFFLLGAGSGIVALFLPSVPSWLLVLHILFGGFSIILALLHGLRTKGQPRGGSRS